MPVAPRLSIRFAVAAVALLIGTPVLGAGFPADGAAFGGGLAPFATEHALGLRPVVPEPSASTDTMHQRLLATIRNNEGLPAGLPVWSARYDGPGANWDIAHGAAADPLGRRVYVTGESVGSGTWQKYATLAYDAATGVELWNERFGGDTVYSDVAHAAATSPDGERVYVTGFAQWSGFSGDYATVAYDGATGARLWVARYHGGGFDEAYDIAASPDGSKVFVTGYSQRVNEGGWNFAYATVAYDAATGNRLWAQRYAGPGGNDYGLALVVSPDSSRVYVTGLSHGGVGQGFDLLTVSYDAASGAEQWVARTGTPTDDKGRGIALSPDATTVYVAGERGRADNRPAFAAAAYDAATGAERWFAGYDGPAANYDVAEGVGVSPDGARVYIGGWSYGGSGPSMDYAAVAFDAATGAQAWASRYNGPGDDDDYAWDLAVGPGDRVYLTGQSWGPTAYDMTTVAFDGQTGQRVWVHRYDGPAGERDYGNAVVVDPLGLRVFAAGYSRGDTVTGSGSLDYATAAHLADPVAVAGAAAARVLPG